MRGGGELAEWLRAPFAENRRLLSFAEGWYRGPAVALLLAAGASELAADARGRLPRDVVSMDARAEGRPRDKGKEVAIGRMLERAAAYRARSWAWPAMKKCRARDLVVLFESAEDRAKSKSKSTGRPVVVVVVVDGGGGCGRASAAGRPQPKGLRRERLGRASAAGRPLPKGLRRERHPKARM